MGSSQGGKTLGRSANSVFAVPVGPYVTTLTFPLVRVRRLAGSTRRAS
jgi:hypothetical protein